MPRVPQPLALQSGPCERDALLPDLIWKPEAIESLRTLLARVEIDSGFMAGGWGALAAGSLGVCRLPWPLGWPGANSVAFHRCWILGP